MRKSTPSLQLVLAGIVTASVLTLAAALAATSGRKGNAAASYSQATAANAGILSSAPLQVDRRDPSAGRIVPADARLERLADGFKWVEGPIWTQGNLFFAEIPSNSIRRWIPGTGVSIFIHPSGYRGAEPYGGPESGSNGMTLDARGRLTIAGHARRNIYRLESLDPKAQITVLADAYQGKKLNSPNDLVYRSDGSLYFTDPPYGLRTQKDTDPEKQLKVNGVYRIPHALSQKPGAPPANGDLQLLVKDLPRPNGIAFSPDEKYLYVSNSEPRKIWMRYRVQPDGTVTDAKLLYDATADERVGGPDGMKVDREGDIYSAGPGGVTILSPDGKLLATLLIPERVSNVAWGGADRTTLYITASSS
ncbi:MAG TPA: SMP-30/gluconolactonase/LRE family protein, partial [Acidobacteriaceae bacterium]|nr:SMP-30/gluconolactonase/LRE family protein [Acidobacteriaceae bacterium]